MSVLFQIDSEILIYDGNLIIFRDVILLVGLADRRSSPPHRIGQLSASPRRPRINLAHVAHIYGTNGHFSRVRRARVWNDNVARAHTICCHGRRFFDNMINIEIKLTLPIRHVRAGNVGANYESAPLAAHTFQSGGGPMVDGGVIDNSDEV